MRALCARVGKGARPRAGRNTAHSDVAILHSYDAFWPINWQRHNNALDPLPHLIDDYGTLRSLTHSIDIVSSSSAPPNHSTRRL